MGELILLTNMVRIKAGTFLRIKYPVTVSRDFWLGKYEITQGEHPVYKIPFLGDRGVPLGIDVFKVARTGILPVFEGIIVSPEGTLVGTGVARAPIECFERAVAAHVARYGES